MEANTKIETLAQLAESLECNAEQAMSFLAAWDAQQFHESADRGDMAWLFQYGLPPMAERWQEVLQSIAQRCSEDDLPEDAKPTAGEIRDQAKDLGWL